MSVRVIIERHVPKEKETEAIKIMTQMRAAASMQKGYISGETLRNMEKSEEFIVISTWHDEEDWKDWRLAKEREKLQKTMDHVLGKATTYRIFGYPEKRSVDWPRFWDSVVEKTEGHGN